MAALGERMVDGGYNILPIAPAQKFPAEYGVNGWRHMSRWNRYALRQPTSQELTHWKTWPLSGIGMPCGHKIVAIDIDLLNADDAYRARSTTEEILGSTPAHRIGEAPKILLVYGTKQEIKSISFGKIDILGVGRQFVSHGDHLRTKKPYSWPNENIADLDRESLPLVTPSQVDDLCEELAKSFPSDCARPFKRPALAPSMPGTSELRAGYSDVKAAMTAIPNPDLSYNEWVRIGMALKGALGDLGADIFLEWSQRSPKNDPNFSAATWLSFKPQSIGAGTIFFHAKLNGWVRPLADYSGHPGRKFFKELNTNG